MLYDYPQYYQAAFAFRDIERETTFLAETIDRYSAVPVDRVLEIGCGPAPHAGELIRRGYHYLGLDNSRVMLNYASETWRRICPAPLLFEANMVSFEAPETADFAFVMLGSLYLNSIEEMHSHFDSIAASLRRGGLYFLDCCIQFADMMSPTSRSRVSHGRNGINVESTFDIRLIDPGRQIYEEVWKVSIDDNGRRHDFEMIERNKAIYPQEFLLFIDQRPDFDFVGWWQDWSFDDPITEFSTPSRPITLLRRV